MLDQTRIATRLSLGVGLAAALLAAIVAAGLSRMQQIKLQLDVMGGDRLPKIIAIKDMKDNVRTRAAVVRNILLLNDPAEVKKQVAIMGELRDEYAQLDQRMQHDLATPEGAAALAKVRAAVAAMDEPTARVIQLGLADNHFDATRLLLDVVRPLQFSALEALDQLGAQQEKQAAQFQRDANEANRSAVVMLVSLGAVALAALALLGWRLLRSITAAIGAAVEVAQAVAAGDLTRPIAEPPGRSETAQLLGTLRSMQGGLASLATAVREHAESVACASAQIATGNSELSSRTEQQASALQQTASAMEELSATVRHNADSAAHANRTALNASEIASQGGAAMARVTETMQRMSASARKIASITGLIDGIAFQTNILALNAAVEAARAGEQGRSFVVVADEVRTLAKRSADAAREIKDLIEATVTEVDRGAALVDAAGHTMANAVESIRGVTTLVGEISTACVEQSAGLAQVGEAIAQMDRATQQNAALVEESAAAAENLRQRAQQLVESVAVFKLATPPVLIQDLHALGA